MPRSVPSPLDPVKVQEEKDAAEAFYADPANRKKSFGFKLYGSESVKKALTALFGNKCAYCESLMPTQPPDVEHFRPKSAVVHDGKLRSPGYWWLAADWDNLLPSCIDCNRARYQEFPDVPEALSGKANQFPLAPGTARAGGPGEEAAEQVLLLDPCRDADPDAHLEFIEKDGLSLVRPAQDAAGAESARGEASIDVYGLKRTNLVNARTDRLLILRSARKRLESAIRVAKLVPADAAAQQEVVDAKAELQRLIDAASPYAGLARQFLRRSDP